MKLAAAIAAMMLAAGSAQAQPGFQRPTQTLQEMAARRGVVASSYAPGAIVYAGSFPDAFDVRPEEPNPYPRMRISSDSEFKVRHAIDAEASRLFHAENWTALEDMADRLRTRDRLTPVGDFKLEAFYEVFRFCHCKHPEEVSAWEARAERYRQAFPQSPTPLLIKTSFMIDDAWWDLQRGPGGSTVRGLAYRTGIDAAGKLMADNWDIVSQDRQAFAVLGVLTVSSEASRPVFDKLIDQIADKAPEYTPAWTSAITYLSRQWGDDPQLVERIARRAALGKGDEAEGLYARLLHHAWTLAGDDGFFRRAGVDRRLLRNSALSFLSQHPDMPNFVMMAEIACSLQDWEMAEPLIARMQVLAVPSYADFPQYTACRRDIYSYRHPAG